MKLRRSLRSTLHPLLAYPLRTALALSGIAVGVAAFLVARAIGDGAKLEMARAVDALGTDLLLVKPLPIRTPVARPQFAGWATTLQPEDVAAIAALPKIRAVAPAIEDTVRVKVGRASVKTKVRGTTADYQSLRRFGLTAGRFISADDERAFRRVAVIGPSVARELFPAGAAVGRELRIRGVPFEIVGTLAPKGATTDSADQDNQVLVPLSTALRRVFNARWLTSAYVGVVEPAAVEETETAVAALLRDRHRRGAGGGADDFAVQSTAKTRAIENELTASLGRYGTGLALIALAVGGAGMLALMLLSVRERTGEIGLRMAVGAQPRAIFLQFLAESFLLAFAGWAAGSMLGRIGVAAVACGTGWTLNLSLEATAIALALTVGIGIGFGAIPAGRATRVPPLVALAQR
ncbi:MAG TPA: ABC transporter permease [Opitutaceae bacterium]|nr:ABC transporter permease [Opitutaceae bacterium]